MVNETIKLLITLIITPLLTSILTLPTLFSTTYIQVFITNPFEFSLQTAKKYIQQKTLHLVPITLLIAIVFTTTTQIATEPTTRTIQTVLAILFLIATIHITLFSSFPKQITQKIGSTTDYYPTERKHTIILTILQIIHILIFSTVFTGIFYIL
jgi:hypothetical protein